jgi:hypothetical protein
MPPTVKAQGNTVYVIHTTPPAAATGIPTTVESNAAIFAGCYIYGDLDLTLTQNTGEGPRKACAKVVPTEAGNVNFPAIEVQYSYSPQDLGTPGSDGNELYEALEPGTTVTVSVLYGIDGRTPTVAVGDVADVFEAEVLRRRKTRTGDGEFDQFSVTQTLIPIGGDFIAEDHVYAAT